MSRLLEGVSREANRNTYNLIFHSEKYHVPLLPFPVRETRLIYIYWIDKCIHVRCERTLVG
jgi:hypothetical protein